MPRGLEEPLSHFCLSSRGGGASETAFKLPVHWSTLPVATSR